MSTAPAPVDDEEPAPLLHRLAAAGLSLGAAGALIIAVSGAHAVGEPRDVRLRVAQCWHQIEEKQAGGSDPHELRVACQALESALMATRVPPPATLTAANEP